MFAASKDTDIPFIFSESQFSLGFEGTLCRVTAKNASNAEKSPDVTVAIAVPTTTRMPALRWQLLSTAPRIITWPHPWEKPLF
jgi:hypothetical protein